MAQAAEKLEEVPRVSQFEFMILDATFTDPKTEMKVPVQFSYEGIHYELCDGQVYSAQNLPAGTDIEALVNHLNTRPGYPIFQDRPVLNDAGVEVGKETVQTGWRPRFRCVNIR